MRIEQVIGLRIQQARKLRHATIPSQAALGRRMKKYLGVEWSRQAVSDAENGKRDFKAAELVALALALEAPISWLIEPSDGGSLEIAEGGPPIRGQDLSLLKSRPSKRRNLRGVINAVAKMKAQADNALTHAYMLSDTIDYPSIDDDLDNG